MSGIEVKKKETKLSDLIDYRIRVATQDGRVYIGQLMAFDAYMNVVLGDCVEERIAHKQVKQLFQGGGDLSANVELEKRALGMIILRGETILSTTVESVPLISKKERLKLDSKNSKKLANAKSARQGQKVKPETSANDKVSKPSEKGPSRYNGNQPVRASRFQAPPGFKKRV